MAGRLEEYNEKRHFEKTPEPEGKLEEPGKRLRFVVQHHIARGDHFDFRLEWGGVLLSWAVPKGPSYDPRDKRLAVEVEDHPLDYRDFEGTIPKGEYGGGAVMIWDEGYWEPQADFDQGRKEGSLKIILYGKRLKGKWALIKLKAKIRETEKNWLIVKERDEYAKDRDGISEFETSVRTGRTLTDISENKAEVNVMRNPFDKISVQLARPADVAPEGSDWLYELKYDGYRIIAFIEVGKVRLITRNGHDYTKKFKEIADSLAQWFDGRAAVLDGEVVIFNGEGKADFQALQNHIEDPEGEKLNYMIFDLLALDGADLRNKSLIERKEKLETFLQGAPEELHYSKHTGGDGKEILLSSCSAGFEGIICKKASSVYSGTRNGDWIKLKCRARQEFVIGGYTVSDKKRNGFSSILLGVYAGNDLVYAGRAGTGFTERSMKALAERFEDIKSETSFFKYIPESRSKENVIWLKPVLIAEIEFAEWTCDGLIRQGSFKGLRTDKQPGEVRRENISAVKETGLDERPEQIITPKGKPGQERPMKTGAKTILINGISITSPDKIMIAGTSITKGDIAEYYDKVSARMMPYVGNRILSIVRCPDGTSKACFYQKHPGPDAKGVISVPVTESSGEKGNYFYIEDAYGLLYEIQMGTIEFHTWGSRINALETPDMIVFDIDPEEGLDLQRVRQGVRDTKQVLDEISLVSFLKTSGGKGYHVVIPLEPSVGWDVVHGFARLMAEAMEQRWPERYTSNVRKVYRSGKIFIDWIRNARSATSVAPYSIRAREGAPVSMPIFWSELDMVEPNSIKMEDALKRIGEEDPWKDFYSIKQKLKNNYLPQA